MTTNENVLVVVCRIFTLDGYIPPVTMIETDTQQTVVEYLTNTTTVYETKAPHAERHDRQQLFTPRGRAQARYTLARLQLSPRPR